eukprot:scaffold14640_cov70-Phaeocystis_antarctica.AAC.3
MVVSKPRQIRHASFLMGMRSTQPDSTRRWVNVTTSHQKNVGLYSLCKKAVACTMRVLRPCRSASRLGKRTSV